MGKESIVKINGHQYRYEYQGGKTVYLGPVGDAPTLSESEFMSHTEGRWHIWPTDVEESKFVWYDVTDIEETVWDEDKNEFDDEVIEKNILFGLKENLTGANVKVEVPDWAIDSEFWEEEMDDRMVPKLRIWGPFEVKYKDDTVAEGDFRGWGYGDQLNDLEFRINKFVE
jgi:hypothetical protein